MPLKSRQAKLFIAVFAVARLLLAAPQVCTQGFGKPRLLIVRFGLPGTRLASTRFFRCIRHALTCASKGAEIQGLSLPLAVRVAQQKLLIDSARGRL